MITYYNCRPGRAVKLTPANIPRRNVRWTVVKNKNGRKSLSAADAQDIRDTLRKDSSETLGGIAFELSVAPEFLKSMLAAHGLFLNFRYKDA